MASLNLFSSSCTRHIHIHTNDESAKTHSTTAATITKQGDTSGLLHLLENGLAKELRRGDYETDAHARNAMCELVVGTYENEQEARRLETHRARSNFLEARKNKAEQREGKEWPVV